MNWLIDLFAAYDVDPRSFAIGVMFGGAAACASLILGALWDARPRRAPRPRGESMSERHDRLDAEAAYFIPKTRPTSSSRKPGRGSR